jgi:polyphenol oxidase
MSGLHDRLRAAALDWIVAEWPVPASVHALVTTRTGGVSSGAHATLDLGPALLDTLDPEERANVVANRARLAAWLPAEPVWIEQVHGAHVVLVDEVNLAAARARAPRGDALVTRLRRVPLAVRVADCLPVCLGSDDGTTIGVAHAGWRGLSAGVLEATLAAMRMPGASIRAWLGPSIGANAFEVGADVRDAFCSAAPQDVVHFRDAAPGKWLADLRGLACARLARAGVTDVRGTGACTHSDAARFFSHRRDRGPGRMAAVIWCE